MDSNSKYLAGLASFQKFGPKRLRLILSFFNQNAESSFKADIKGLKSAGIEQKIAEEYIAARKTIDLAEIEHKMQAESIKISTPNDELYPEKLKTIYNPPQILFFKGSLKANNAPSLAIVGSRKISSYGKQIINSLVRDLAKKNISIISGLAFGVDAEAHKISMEEQTYTLAVLGSGIDSPSIYPAHHRFLADQIVSSGGAILSEFPLGTAPLKHNFPQRNRIVSGISLGVILVEAGEKSGALITAKYAAEQGREVFAVPGSIYSPTSKGTNNIIKQGAKLITNSEDVIEALDLVQISTYINNKKILPENKYEEKILNTISKEPLHIDELIRLSGLNAKEINQTVPMMELKGMIKNVGGMQYIINN